MELFWGPHFPPGCGKRERDCCFCQILCLSPGACGLGGGWTGLLIPEVSGKRQMLGSKQGDPCGGNVYSSETFRPQLKGIRKIIVFSITLIFIF